MAMIVNSTEWFPREQNGAGNWAPITGSDVEIVSAGEYALEVGAVVNVPMQATGDPVPQWRMVDTASGNVIGTKGFPPGLSISAAGVITGTVGGSPATYTVSVQAYNAFSSATKILRFAVVPANTGTAPVIVSAEGGNILHGSALSRQFQATGTPQPTWVVSAGILPPGLSLSPAGLLAGTPTAVGEFTFTILASNNHGNSDRTVTLAVHQAPLIIVNGAVNIPNGTPTDIQLVAIGYPVPVWELVGGSIPPGLSLTANGRIVGTTTSSGSHVIFVTASNAVTSVTQQITLTVAGANQGTARRTGQILTTF